MGQSILTFPNLTEGTLIKRYKRFMADVMLKDGTVVTAHCPNTGPMKGVLRPQGRVRLSYQPSTKRKLQWTWEQAEVVDGFGSKCWAGLNTALPNKLIKLAIEEGLLSQQLGKIQHIKPEVKYGLEGKSRIDLLLTPVKDASDSRQIYLEVKNTTWIKGSVGLFPDTVTERGQKHLIELMSVIPESRAILVPCLSRNDIQSFSPGKEADPYYAQLFEKSLKKGVEVIPCCFGFHLNKITWEGIRPLKLQYD